MVKFYMVGGCVRDTLMARKHNDMDYSVEAPSYEAMCEEIVKRGGRIFDVPGNKEHLTVKANIPNMGGVCDFVLCRKEGKYIDGRHPTVVEHGVLADDLARRDFTMNAMAMGEDGKLIDLYGGEMDIACGVIRCVGHTQTRFAEDGLRILRAMRFSITLGFTMSSIIEGCLKDQNVVRLLANQKNERIYEELLKAFRHDTRATISMFGRFPLIADAIFDAGNLWLQPTLKQR